MNLKLSFQTTLLLQTSPKTLTPAISVVKDLGHGLMVLHKLKNSLHDYKTDPQELCSNYYNYHAHCVSFSFNFMYGIVLLQFERTLSFCQHVLLVFDYIFCVLKY